MKYMLIKADPQGKPRLIRIVGLALTVRLTQQWRWSSFGNYWIYSLETNETWPLVPPLILQSLPMQHGLRQGSE